MTYRGGPIVRVAPGPTLLEISRMKDVPHASVCGGRARCSTCRVGVESGLESLPPPSAAEAMTLAGINAPRQRAPRLPDPPPARPSRSRAWWRRPRAVAGRAQASPNVQGVERTLAVLFLDTRGFTAISEARLPYDVVFILNRLFAEVGEAIRSHDGKIDKYLGDGLMAIFGTEAGEAAGCRQALRAARDIDLALDRLNDEIMEEIGQPLRVGMGIDVGPLVVGHIGHAETAMLTVIGTTVNAASRLEALTKEKNCQLIAALDVLAHAGLSPDAFAQEEVMIRGLSAPRAVALIDRARNLPHLPEQSTGAEQRAGRIDRVSLFLRLAEAVVLRDDRLAKQAEMARMHGRIGALGLVLVENGGDVQRTLRRHFEKMRGVHRMRDPRVGRCRVRS